MDLTGQWADSLLALERLYFTKVVVWGALCILGGSGTIVALLVRRLESPLLKGFAQVTSAFGAIVIAAGLAMRSTTTLRDLEGAIALDRWLWFGIGFDAGLVLLGAALAILGVSWRSTGPERPGLVGAGIAVIVQGLALAVLALQLTAGLVR